MPDEVSGLFRCHPGGPEFNHMGHLLKWLAAASDTLRMSGQRSPCPASSSGRACPQRWRNLHHCPDSAADAAAPTLPKSLWGASAVARITHRLLPWPCAHIEAIKEARNILRRDEDGGWIAHRVALLDDQLIMRVEVSSDGSLITQKMTSRDRFPNRALPNPLAPVRLVE